MQQPAPSPDSPAPKVLVIPVTRPLAWLADGWRDLRYAPGVSLVHGILVAVGGWTIAAISLLWIPLLPGAFSGFVLVAPILATGLYEMSRCRERGKPGDMACALAAWRRGHLRGITEGTPAGVAPRSARVALVRVSDIYDEFSGGRVDATAIRNFLQYAWAEWGEAEPGLPPPVAKTNTVAKVRMSSPGGLETASGETASAAVPSRPASETSSASRASSFAPATSSARTTPCSRPCPPRL